MITSRTLVASLGAALAAILAMAWLSLAEAGQGGLDAALGKALFDRLWVAAPASTAAADGLGPLFNARSCAACHQGGGAARLISDGGKLEARGLVVRVGAKDGARHPELGAQLQDRAVAGLMPEARVAVRVKNGALSVSPSLNRQPDEPAVFEARLAPSLRGRALLDQVDSAAVLALADPEDRDGDGISGRPHLLRDGSDTPVLGRYGAKASVASLEIQVAEAAALDLGLSSPLVPHPAGDCTDLQPDCTARPSGRSDVSDGEEISAEVVRLIAAYLHSLKPSPVDPSAEGLRLFSVKGCAACHVPSLPSRDGSPLPVFTDLLLHDLASGGASHLQEGDAQPAEWRTAPLRGLDPLAGARRYLHDGRAATLREAILHHGGEGARARDAFLGADAHDQQILLDFLAKL